MTKKSAKSSGTKKVSWPAKKAAAKPVARRAAPAAPAAPAAKVASVAPAARPAAAAKKTPPSRTAVRQVVTPRPAVAVAPVREASLLERAERLRDNIHRSKLTHPDPWAYTMKARGWGQRAQALVDEIAGSGENAGRHKALEALAAAVEGDRDFRQARGLF